MPTTYTNRVITILAVLWIAISAIYPRVPGSLLWFFDPTGPISTEHALRPGIDMVGGTSLTYEIKQPEGVTSGTTDLAEKVATSLKQRVDPQGVRNLIWRPQGATRLEIQMPMTRKSIQGQALRDAFNAAKDKLEATNIRVPSVVSDMESLAGHEREVKLQTYAQDSKTRQTLIDQMVKLADDLKAARERKDPQAAAAARLQYEPLQEQLDQTNLPATQLDSILDANVKERDVQVNKIYAKSQDFPSRRSAVEGYVLARDKYVAVRDTLDDASDLKRKLRGSGVLSFHILAEPTDPLFQTMAERLRTDGPRAHPGDVARWFATGKPNEFLGRGVPYRDKVYVLGYTDPERSMINAAGRPPWGLSGAFPSNDNGELSCAFEFNSQGSKLFGELTGRFKPQGGRTTALAIVLDDIVVSAPQLNAQIFGSGRITGGNGGFSRVELDDLVSKLSAGSLPAQLTDEPISEVTVGPQLGEDNLRAGLLSCGLGLVVVCIFLITYYYLSGVVAFISVLINLILILGAMAAINATFTLPGVAGVVLSVAIAVDANVLIFERLREEQARGLSLRVALDHSYSRAFSAIFDGQVTTAISSLFLFLFGSEEVRGFGLTLLIGIVTSLFTALFVGKTIFGLMVDKFGVKDLSSLPRTFPAWGRLLHPNIDWLKLSWAFLTFSALFIGGGLLCFAIKFNQGQALGIEFSGGTAVQIALNEPKPGQPPLDRAAIQKMVEDQSGKQPDQFADPHVVAVGNDNLQYEISTPTTDVRSVQKAVIEAIGDRLEVDKPSQFAGMNDAFEVAENKQVLPIENTSTRIAGVPGSMLQAHVGGVAIVLDGLNPPLAADKIRNRVLARKDQEKSDQQPEKVEVETFDGDTRAVILMSDSRYVFDPANSNSLNQWRGSLAGPAWQIVKDAVNNPPQLKGVTSFNAQVADEAKWNTVIAMGMSVLGIMAYIWFRFGNFKFGTATVVACVHDAAFVVAAIGFSFYLGQSDIIERGLLIHPFRVDLTLVAAVLTVVGYSLNDTVVIFDRVRENRGKYGALSRGVINDSINQTFGRTLLTGGTSMGILLIMYLLGGEGIHGFTFVMLLGIIVGTYSSIAVASPLLLVGNDAKQPSSVLPVRATAVS